MPFNGSGTFVLPAVTGFPAVAGQKVRASTFNNVFQDVFDGLTGCMTRSGQSPATGDIPFGNHKATGVADATATGDALAYGQATPASLTKLFTSAGSAGAPSIYPAGDTSTGRWYPSASVVAESAAGVEVLRWTSAGFGIGVGASPARKLHVKDTGGLARFETTTPRGGGANFVEFHDPSGVKGWVGYNDAGTDNMGVMNSLNADIIFGTGATPKVRVLGAGHLVPNANNTYTCGGSTRRWNNVYMVNLDASGPALLGGDTVVGGKLDVLTHTGNVAGGVYTPVSSALVNLNSAVPGLAHFVRVGSVVYVTGEVSVTPTGAGTISFNLTLPVGSGLTLASDASGVASMSAQFQAGSVAADPVNDRLQVTSNSVTGGVEILRYAASYEVK